MKNKKIRTKIGSYIVNPTSKINEILMTDSVFVLKMK